MKKLFKKTLAVIMVVVMTLTAAPVVGIVSEAHAKDISDFAVGDVVEFGSYPQSRVTDSKTISALNAINVTMKSYGYYISGSKSNFMKYADVSYNNEKYRKVVFTSYRPYWTKNPSSYTEQSNNGYYTDTVYWFKFDSISWVVLDPDSGLLLCNNILDSQNFHYTDRYPTWANSDMREWLNSDFLNAAFTTDEKSKIKNSIVQTHDYANNDGGADTVDKVFLLSYNEVLSSEYGFTSSYTAKDSSRQKRGTEYAKCQGLWQYNNYGDWWLRTPGDSTTEGKIVDYDGAVNIYSNITDTGVTSLGVCPAIKVTEIEEKTYEIYGREFEDNLDYYAENTNSSDYNPVLANMMAALSKAVYSESDINSACESLGFETYGVYDYGSSYNPHTCGYSFALKKSDYSDDMICLVSVRGSQKLNYNADWIGNLEIATEDEKHIGFSYPANRIYETIQNVVGDKGLNVKYFITGHSRGAAVANLLSVKLMENGVSSSDIYNYNFACPDVACKKSFSYYSNIFNLCNREDVVPFIPGNFASALTSPGTSWGKFGKTYWFTKDAPDTINPFADHDMGLYLEFFDQQLAPSDWGKSLEDKWDDAVHTLYGWITKIMCPVDVVITDENGNNIASVIGGEVNYYNSQVGDVLIFTDGDKKVIYINGDNDFNVNLVGTDSGEMTYSVERYNVQGEEVLESKTFTNVKLEEGKQMYSPVSDADIADDVELFVTEKQNEQQVVTHTVSTSGVETAVGNEIPAEPSDPSIDLNEITLKINKPSTTAINFGDTLVLQLEEIEIPEGYAVAWFVEGAGVSTKVNADGTECRVTSIANGSVTITAKLVDENGEPVTNADGEEIFDEITLTSKAGFWQKLVSFFKNLFGANRIIY